MRYHGFDSLRASMMLLGVYLHVVCGYTPIPDVWWYKDQQTTRFFDLSLLAIHVFRMPVFFVMAGFFGALIYERRGAIGFVRNRSARILVPFVAALAILYPILAFLGAYGRHWWKPDAVARAVDHISSGSFLSGFHPTHLWFLDYLIFLYALAFIWIRIPVQLFRRLMESRFALALPVLATFGTLCLMEFGLLDTPHEFIPVPRIFLAYAVFFAFGWALYSIRDVLGVFEQAITSRIAVAAILILGHFYFIDRQLADRSVREWFVFIGAAATGALAVWLLVFALIGLFNRYMNQPSSRMRYLADSSYWVYLIHAPVVLFFHVALAPWTVSGIWKGFLVLALSTPVLLISYDLLCRPTFIGRVLNGRMYSSAILRAIRQRRRTTAASAPTDLAALD